MTISHALDVLREEQLVEAYPGRGVFITDHSAPGPGSDEARRDPAITSLRDDHDQLAAKVARIERILADGGTGRLIRRDLMAALLARELEIMCRWRGAAVGSENRVLRRW